MTPPAPAAPRPRAGDTLRVALLLNLVLQGVIIVTGGLVRLTGSGLGCPTWPECTPGSFVPVPQQPQGWHVFVEFGNRLMTFLLTAAAVWVLVAAIRRARGTADATDARFVRWAAVPLLGIVAQAILGGISVLTKLDPQTVSPHFLLSVVLVAYSAWLLVRYDADHGAVATGVPATLRRPALLAGAVFAVVVCLGTAVTGSGPHSGDAGENVRFGFDPVTTSRVHSGAVWVFVICLIVIAVRLRHEPAPPAYRRWWTAALHLSIVEGIIGYTQYALALPAGLVAVHMLISAALTAIVTFGVLAARPIAVPVVPPVEAPHLTA